MDLDSKDIEGLREMAKGNLYFLSKGVLGNDQLSPAFHGELCRAVEGPSLRKLFCIPRGFFKTTNCTKARAIQRSLQDPGVTQLICMQQHDNAAAVVNDIRNQWEKNAVLQALFPELVPTGNAKWSGDEARLNRPAEVYSQPQSTYEASGIGTSLQSRHYDVIYADDLVVAKKDQTTGVWMQPSEEDIQKAIGWHQLTWGLARNVQTLEYLQIMTRWCPNDLYDYFTTSDAEKGNWTVYLRSALCDDGSAAFPEKYPLDALGTIKQSQGTYKFSTQYLCKPLDSGMLLFGDLYHVYLRGEEPESFRKVIASIDPAIAQKRNSHPTALVVIGQTKDGQRYVLEALNKRLTPSEQVDAIFNSWERLRFTELAIEAIAYQESLCYAVEDRFKKLGGRPFRVTPIRPGRGESKEARIEGLQPSFEGGWWYVRADRTDLMGQLDQYPMGTYDDLLDALAQGLRILPPHKGVNATVMPPRAFERTMMTYEEIMKNLESKNKHSGKLWSRQEKGITPVFSQVMANAR